MQRITADQLQVDAAVAQRSGILGVEVQAADASQEGARLTGGGLRRACRVSRELSASAAIFYLL